MHSGQELSDDHDVCFLAGLVQVVCRSVNHALYANLLAGHLVDGEPPAIKATVHNYSVSSFKRLRPRGSADLDFMSFLGSAGLSEMPEGSSSEATGTGTSQGTPGGALRRHRRRLGGGRLCADMLWRPGYVGLVLREPWAKSSQGL